MIDFELPDLDCTILVRDMVRKIANINSNTTTSDIFELSNELNKKNTYQDLTLHLTEPQARALDLILDLFKDINADEVDEAFNISKVLKISIAPSDVSRFINLLQEFGLIQYITHEKVSDLFMDWCMQRHQDIIARDCMDLIVETGNLAWKDAYSWLCNNDSNNYTEVEKELNMFKEVVCQKSQDN